MPPRAKAGKAKEIGARRRALNDQLLAELRRMQDDLHTLTEHFEVRVGGALNELITRLDGDPSIDQPARPATLRQAQAMLDAIQATTIRTKKGRAKQLARLEELVRQLSEIQT